MRQSISRPWLKLLQWMFGLSAEMLVDATDRARFYYHFNVNPDTSTFAVWERSHWQSSVEWRQLEFINFSGHRVASLFYVALCAPMRSSVVFRPLRATTRSPPPNFVQSAVA
jgi:hypothetical protein